MQQEKFCETHSMTESRALLVVEFNLLISFINLLTQIINHNMLYIFQILIYYFHILSFGIYSAFHNFLIWL